MWMFIEYYESLSLTLSFRGLTHVSFNILQDVILWYYFHIFCSILESLYFCPNLFTLPEENGVSNFIFAKQINNVSFVLQELVRRLNMNCSFCPLGGPRQRDFPSLSSIPSHQRWQETRGCYYRSAGNRKYIGTQFEFLIQNYLV